MRRGETCGGYCCTVQEVVLVAPNTKHEGTVGCLFLLGSWLAKKHKELSLPNYKFITTRYDTVCWYGKDFSIYYCPHDRSTTKMLTITLVLQMTRTYVERVPGKGRKARHAPQSLLKQKPISLFERIQEFN